MTPEAKEKRREYFRKWAEKHKEELKIKKREWQRANKDKVKEYQARYWENKAKKEGACI